MHSLKELYKIGNGPSSSHTIGPKRATELFLTHYHNLDFVKVTLYGSLALTGKGHLTDYIIDKTLGNIKHEIVFNYLELMPHPNTMIFEGYINHNLIAKETIISVGGGSIKVLGEPLLELQDVYPHKNLYEIKNYCKEKNIDYASYVYRFDLDIKPYLEKIYDTMLNAIQRGLESEGTLHGDLHVIRKAKSLYNAHKKESDELQRKRRLIAYAYAVAEENASGGEIVTAPTCGASGIIPSCLRTMIEAGISKDKLIDGLAVAGLFGNLIKFNASISGAEAGCQAEVGSACSMASAMIAHVYGLSLDSIEQAAEIALEHHLGLTCDPIMGYVQIPCIERNAAAALRAFDASTMASMLNSKESKISFDLVCKTMLETGRDLGESYRETSIGGLARNYK